LTLRLRCDQVRGVASPPFGFGVVASWMFTTVLSESQSDRRGRASSAMAFFYEFLEHLICKCMEDPEERRIKLNEALRQNLEDAKKARENWNQPTKPWGFWTSDKNRLMWEEERRPSVEKVMGRLSPYEAQ